MASNKSYGRARASVDMSNKENFKADMFRASVHTSSSNGRVASRGNDSKKERRPFRCERLSSIFSRDISSNKEKEKGEWIGIDLRRLAVYMSQTFKRGLYRNFRDDFSKFTII